MKIRMFVLSLFGVAISALAATPALAAGITGTGTLQIEGKCLDLPGWQTAAGTPVNIYDCNGGTNQVWTLDANGTIHPSFDSTKCLDLPNGQTTNGTPIHIYDCNGGSNQQWTLGGDGKLQGVGGKCVDNPGWETTNGTPFQYFDCNGGVNQSFTLGPPNTPPTDLDWNFSLGGGVTGSVDVAIFPDGSVDFMGGFHDGGFWDYDVQMACIVKDSNAHGYSLTFSGSVHGDESSWLGGSRDADFSQSGSSDTLKNAWYAIETEQQIHGDAITCTASDSSDVSSLLNQIGAATGVAGLVISVIAL